MFSLMILRWSRCMVANNIVGPVYAIDSYSGKVGKSGNIHRVAPDGTRTNYVGATRGDGTKRGAGQFNMCVGNTKGGSSGGVL